MMGRADAAAELSRSGCACSQAVLGAFASRYGLDEDTAMKIAAGFAGGMRRAETCGAVTGAYMVLGLAHCQNDCRSGPGRATAHAAVVAFAAEFERRHQTLNCRALLGCDVTTPDGLEAARQQDLFATRCARFVRDAAEILEATLPPE